MANKFLGIGDIVLIMLLACIEMRSINNVKGIGVVGLHSAKHGHRSKKIADEIERSKN